MTVKKTSLYAIIFVLSLMLSHVAFCDTLYTEDGSVRKGLVVENHHDRVVLSTSEGESTVFKKDIDEIFFGLLEDNYYYLANRFAADGDFQNAEKFFKKALGVNPDYDKFRMALYRLEEARDKASRKWKPNDIFKLLFDQLGISIAKEDGFCKVVKVRDSDIFRTGDAVSAVWDESTKFMTKNEVAERLCGIPRTTFRVKIQRKVNFTPGHAPWYFRIFGFKGQEVLPLEMYPEGLTVGRVGHNSSATASGIKSGDRILSINGESTRYMPLNKARSLMRGKSHGVVEFIVERETTITRRGE